MNQNNFQNQNNNMNNLGQFNNQNGQNLNIIPNNNNNFSQYQYTNMPNNFVNQQIGLNQMNNNFNSSTYIPSNNLNNININNKLNNNNNNMNNNIYPNNNISNNNIYNNTNYNIRSDNIYNNNGNYNNNLNNNNIFNCNTSYYNGNSNNNFMNYTNINNNNFNQNINNSNNNINNNFNNNNYNNNNNEINVNLNINNNINYCNSNNSLININNSNPNRNNFNKINRINSNAFNINNNIQEKFIKQLDNINLIEEINVNKNYSIFLGYEKKNENNKESKYEILEIKSIPIKNIQEKEIEKEIDPLLRINHKNIINFKCCKKSKNNYYIITEYCNGGSLNDFQKYYINEKNTQFNESFIQKVIRQIASGLEYIHENNTIYRDLNLENIYINFDKYPNIIENYKLPRKVDYSEINLDDPFTLKIANFGNSKNLENSNSTVTVIGTAKNMAPDMVLMFMDPNSKKGYDKRIDIWSLGIVTYKLLTGKDLFEGDKDEDIYKKIMEGKYNLPSSLYASVEIITFLNGLLQYYPDKRMDWEQIKSHPFLNNNVENFTYIELESLKNEETEEITMNSKEDCDSLLAILFNKINYKNNETQLILGKINDIFSSEKLSSLKTDADILNYFAEKEEECENYINTNFKSSKFLKDININTIEQIFYENSSIKVKTEEIYSKLQEIEKENIKSEKEYFDKLKNIFGEVKFPKFLIDNYLKIIQTNLFSSERNTQATTIITKVKKKEINKDNKNLIIFFEKIRENEINFFEGVQNKNELLNLFIIINNKVFHKSYCGEPFFNFLKTNENLIKQYFIESFDYKEIFKKYKEMKEEQENTQIEKLFKTIEKDIDEKNDNIYIILASLYYLLFYKFKDSNQLRDDSNIGNVYINLILKNFVIFLDEKLLSKLNLKKSLFELLNDLYLHDIYIHLIKQNFYNFDNKNKIYNYDDIDSILSEVSEEDIVFKKKYEKFKGKIEEGLFTIIRKKINNKVSPEEQISYKKNIKLISLDENILSNTITIIVDGYFKEDQNLLDEWKDFIEKFSKHTMFYFYKWPSDYKNNILKDGIFKRIKKATNNFKDTMKRAKKCGKLLAYILFSNKFFKNFQINLVGFSLGNHVINYCLNELYKMNDNNKFIKIKNVIFIGAATHFDRKIKWKKNLEEIVIDKFINCYSSSDNALKMLYSLSLNKTAFGNEILEIKKNKKFNQVLNYNFSQENFDQFSYNYGIVAKKIQENFKFN